MKYIRTKSKIYEVESEFLDNAGKWVGYNIVGNDMAVILKIQVIDQADTIEELCDEFVLVDKTTGKPCINNINDYYYLREEVDEYEVFGAIWTNKGLIYVAKMNDEGVLELL